MDELAQFEGIGDQFRFLLQPVRDLAKNWDIDIKHYLEDYLIKLSKESGDDDSNGHHKLYLYFYFIIMYVNFLGLILRKLQ